MASVLVVDDEKSIRNTLGEFLRMDGHEARTAEDADAALALMAQCAFDVVVTDIILPRASGVTLLQQIREQAPDVQVVMMTGEPTVDTAVQAVRAGAHDYLSKPVSKRDLLAAVGQAARFKALMDEKHRLEAENRQYQENLEQLVGERTEALATRTRQLEALLRATRSIMAGLDLQGILDRILTEAAGMSGCPNVQVFLVDRKAGALRVEAVQGLGTRQVGSVLPLGTGLSSLVAQTGQPVFSEDLTQDPRNLVAEQDRALGLVAWLGLPIRIRDEVLGVLAFSATAPRHYPPDEVVYLTSFADQAAIAIENARLYEARVRQLKELKALYDLGQAISSSLSLDEQLGLLVERLSQAAGAQRVLVGLGDAEDTGRLRLSLAYDASKPDPWLRHLNLSPDRYPEILESIRTARPLVIPEVVAEPLLAPVREGLKPLDLRSMIVMPLIVREKTIGAISLGYVGQARTFTDEQIGVLWSFATQAAIAIEKARLYEAIRQHAAELEARVQERTHELAAANQQLREASRHKSEFLANMSHELRTPLNSILGFSQLLLEQTQEVLPAKQTRFLSNIHNSGQHLLQLINDILDLSKVEAGRVELELEALPVAATLEDILVIGRGLANKKGQLIETEIAPGLPPLQADPVRFKQILFNLLSNAIKFTPAGGRITVTARRICDFRFPIADSKNIGPEPQSQIANQKSQIRDCVEIAVTDTGAGIRAEDLPKLFQEFVQLETTRAQKHEGTGLGLALTRRLVELHGGRIWAASDGEGCGSTFTVVLPFEGPGS